MPVPHFARASQWWRESAFGLALAIACVLFLGFANYAWMREHQLEYVAEPDVCTRSNLESLASKLEYVRETTGSFPEHVLGAVAAGTHKDDDTAHVRYLARDGWGRAVRYVASTDTMELRSAGPDGVLESADDLVARSTPETRTRDRLRRLAVHVRWKSERAGYWFDDPYDIVDQVHDSAFVDYRNTDAWGRRGRYQRMAEGFDLRSAGADGAFDTADDVVVTEEDVRPNLVEPPYGTPVCAVSDA